MAGVRGRSRRRPPGRSGPAEFEPKGGLVVAHDEQQLAALRDLGTRQAAAGVAVQPLDAGALREAEPRLSADLAGGALYPQDCQVQPMRAALAYLALARRHGAVVVAGAAAIALETTAGSAGSAAPRARRDGTARAKWTDRAGGCPPS